MRRPRPARFFDWLFGLPEWREFAPPRRLVRGAFAFALSRAVVPLMAGTLMVAAALGVVLGDYGAFHVVWRDPGAGGRFGPPDVFWNGAGLGLFLCVMAYEIYLLAAWEAKEAERGDWARGRCGVVLALAAPPLLATCWPALFSDVPDGARGLLPAGVAAGVAVFFAAVLAMTVAGRAGADVGDAADGAREGRRVALQADGLAAVVAFLYAALVGYTLRPDTAPATPGATAESVLGAALLILLGLTVAAMLFRGWGPARRYATRLAKLFGALGGACCSAWLVAGAGVYGVAALLVAAAAGGAWWAAANRPKAAHRVGAAASLAVALYLIGAIGWNVRQAGGGWGAPAFAMTVVGAAGLWAAARFLRSKSGPAGRHAPGQKLGAAGVVRFGAAGLLFAALGAAAGYALSAEARVPPAPLSAALLLAVGVTVYGTLRRHAGAAVAPTFAGVAALFLLVSSVRPYPHLVAGLDYSRPNRPDGEDNRKRYLGDDFPPPSAGGLPDGDVLERWRDAVDPGRAARSALAGGLGGGEPPLVIVTTAGGATTSAVYTFRALVEFEKRLPGFRRHVRIVTGASGGMLGAAAYRAWLRDVEAAGAGLDPGARPADEKAYRAELERIAAPYAAGAAGSHAGLDDDYLSPIVQALAFKDLPMGLGCPLGYADDRGLRLERAWVRSIRTDLTETRTESGPVRASFGTLTFAQMRAEEATGRYPSLVFSPMTAEDGRPLFVSTLKLDELVLGRYPVDGHGEALRTRAQEFFGLFPESWETFRLTTAARLSATFPYFSPAATLPTIPPRQVVDAGYYDNYGMAAALAWLQKNAVEEPRVQGRAGRRVILVELRPYAAWRDNALTDAERRSAARANGPARVPRFGWPLHELTTPPSAGNAARQTSMATRNDGQFELLRIAAKTAGVDLERVQFRGDLTDAAALNWVLPDGELRAIRGRVAEFFPDASPADGAEPGDHRAERNRAEWAKLARLLGSPHGGE